MLKLKRGDILLLAVLVLVGSAWLLLREAAENRQTVDPSILSAVITVDGKPYANVPLDGPEQTVDIQTEYGHNTLKVFDQGIQMIYADCPKKISMQMGFISRPGETIICVPNRVYVEIVSTGGGEQVDDGIDAYVR
ncbi:NusG domain II-containing protein [Paenibacillus macerans]|uniref:NusG domain II-containing protein n=1 Tax=Paenibacillus macerans TaxID=44252 RepID=UPI00203F4B01|nr:NusG domain II-containing protein [Paenibacillus macerans]MCM3703175.1 NusG domain II-containing protein [Paenibacillus macerans]